MGEKRDELDGLDPAEVGLIRQYLLGRLEEAEREAFEQRYFSESGDLERLAVVEDELIEDYLKGDLDVEDRQRFVDHFLRAPRRQARLELIRRLFDARTSGALPRAPRSRWPWLAAAGLVAFGVWATLGRQAPPTPVVSPPSAPPMLPTPQAGRREAPLVSLALASSGVRGASPLPSVRPPRDAGLELLVPARGGASTGDYRARLETVEGGIVLALEPVGGPAPAKTLRFVMPAAHVRPGDYILFVSRSGPSGKEEEELGSFPFRIEPSP